MNATQRERYQRQIVIPPVGEEGQERILRSRVLVVGVGGLGSPAAYYLAAAGVGFLGLVDGDVVSESNLQRQIIHSTSTLGVRKVESAAARVRELNPGVTVRTYEGPLTRGNAPDLVRQYDVVLSCLDNMEARYALNDACVAERKPFVEGGVMRFNGLATTVVPGVSPCYRCIFPETPREGMMTPAQAGVIGPAPGVIGSVQAVEAIKIILGIGDLLTGRLLLIDLLGGSFREVSVQRNPSCPACGGMTAG